MGFDFEYFLELFLGGLTRGSIYALIALGYKPAEAARVGAAGDDESVVDSEEMIRRAPKSVGSA